MKTFDFSYKESCLLTPEELGIEVGKLQIEIEKVKSAIDVGGYESEYASVNLPADRSMRAHINQVVAEKKALKPTVLLVIGIGGSNLGTMAVHEALFGTLYNAHNPDLKVYFIDTVDSDSVYDMLLLVNQELESDGVVIANIISKSGTTTETIANFEIVYGMMRGFYGKTYPDYMVVTTDRGSKLWDFALKEHIACLEIPAHVGGRYSVFSPVGLFPLALLGVDIDALCQGAQDMLPVCTSTDISQNPAAISAALLAYYNKNSYNIHDTFLFSVDLRSLGLWYRQLMAESIGKEHNTAGKQVYAGITPTVSIGSTDLHSVAQLYLGGPYDKFTTFVAVEKNKFNLVVPEYAHFEGLVSNLQNKPLSVIMNAILRGTQMAYTKNKRPFVTITLPEKTAYYVGQFMQCKMLEIMYLGFLLDINPFDQPNVQLYKKETRRLL